MTQLTNIYNNVVNRRKQSLDFIGKERRQVLLQEQHRKEEELVANIDFVDKAERLKEVTRLA